ncbi:MAG: septum site-determining protein MinC [Leptolyngbyaceae bacterium]|nr:septum site-determining protein MinC [Leptolyngbyaceae bacterium]
MTSDSTVPVDSSTPAPVESVSTHEGTGLPNQQIRLKTEGGRLLLILPPDNESDVPSATWSELWQQLKHRLSGNERFWSANTPVYLLARDRLLDARQLQEIADVLAEATLFLKRVYTSRRQTAVAAVTVGYSVEQHSPVSRLNQSPDETASPLADPLYLTMTVRSGVEIRHPGTVILQGDVNPGGSIVADGDVIVWGNLRGVAQAGASGNTKCLVMALKMTPTQIRIADAVARSPETPPEHYQPEVAYISDDGICITNAAEFQRMRLNT